jgi:peptidoglycan hydrolase-like protein with peptidoglycan-binding domain
MSYSIPSQAPVSGFGQRRVPSLPTHYRLCGSNPGVQRILSVLGYYAGPIDGLVTPVLFAAIDRFRAAEGLRVVRNQILSRHECRLLGRRYSEYRTRTNVLRSKRAVKHKRRTARAPRGSIRGLGQPPGYTGSPPYCGNPTVAQQMLYDLGYYAGPMDGDFGTNSLQAMSQFKREEGLGSGYVTRSDCERLAKRWNEKMGSTPAPRELPSTETGILSAEFRRLARQRVRAPVVDERDTTNGGMTYDTAAADAGIVERASEWWGEQGTMTKAAIIGGGVAVVGGSLFLMSR